MLCECLHEEGDQFFKDTLQKIYSTTEFSLEFCLTVNGLLSHVSQGKSVLERALGDRLMKQFQQDFDGLKAGTFSWHEISKDDLVARVTVLEQLNEFIGNLKKSSYRNQAGEERTFLACINFNPFKQLFSLQRMAQYIHYPNWNFGQEIYNKSVQFYTYLLNFFVHAYLLPDLAYLQPQRNHLPSQNGILLR